MTILNYITLKNIIFPKILNFLNFSDTRRIVRIKKNEQLLKHLLKIHDAQQQQSDPLEMTEQEIIIKQLELFQLHNVQLDDEILKSNSFFNFYYKMYDASKMNNFNHKVILEYVQNLIQKTPKINYITEDYRYYIYFKAQIIVIGMAIRHNIPLTSLLLCTRLYMNSKQQLFCLEFSIFKEIFKELYSKRQLSQLNYLLNVDQLINNDTLKLTEMQNYRDKVFIEYEDVLKENNFTLFQQNLDLIYQQKHYLINELKDVIEKQQFKELHSDLKKFHLQIDYADQFYQTLNKIISFCDSAEQPFITSDKIGIPQFIKKYFYKTHERKELNSQQLVESLLTINKVLSEMIKNRFPFPPIISYLNLKDPNSLNILNITKEFVIECQENQTFLLFLSSVHYNFQTLAQSKDYSRTFYNQQLQKQDFDQWETVIQMLEIIEDNQSIIKHDVEKRISEEDTKSNIQAYLQYPKEQITNYLGQYQKISKLLRNLISFQNKEVSVKFDVENLKNSLLEKINHIKSKVVSESSLRRKLGRPPGTKNIKIKKKIRVERLKDIDVKEFKSQKCFKNFPTSEFNSDEEVVILKKRKLYQSEQMLMQDIENFLV
ncbi:unnamed protein product (macronuclear) [Paramecium tetraurelia]|uniref:Uncharacterized protein n=1 Tax=Paramecium tetraurelia TaxID=5888 RepID=A0BQE0_PARTE|nr:uncharacterized protein GSPATT00030986001 [Paramecium tetraurelia]CAK60757.1 unnamed protein product [Paramecium tetraurelia]|eukprot:XP_001428155.1 hypothetical protein (macronuclear) [Paramecium tetraurelia strain d4-2]